MFNGIRNRIYAHWQDWLDGFWLVPGLVALLGPLLALLLLWLDSLGSIPPSILTFGGSVNEARTLLSIVVSALITVAGVVLSITIVTLQLVSSQFTPRALRALLSDRITQATFGGFLGIFVYCMIVLISLRDPIEGVESGFLPRLGVGIALELIFLAVVLLVVFFSHISSVIQVSHIASRLAHQTLASITHLYPVSKRAVYGEDGTALVQKWQQEAEPVRIFAQDVGYIQSIDLEHLTESVPYDSSRLQLLVCPGDFVTQTTVLMKLWSLKAVMPEHISALQGVVALARERDLAQDAAFGVRQLADICLRALSPAINDPSTAVLCIGYLRSLLERIANAPAPASVHRFAQKSILVARYYSFDEYMSVFLEIGTYASNNPRVVGALLDAILSIANATCTDTCDERYPFLLSLATTIVEQMLQKEHSQLDRDVIVKELEQLKSLVQQKSIAYRD